MTCQTCSSERIAKVHAKASDLHHVKIARNEHDGYLPHDFGIGGGDDVDFSYCLDCGQIQGKFPLELTELEQKETPEEQDIGDDYATQMQSTMARRAMEARARLLK